MTIGRPPKLPVNGMLACAMCQQLLPTERFAPRSRTASGFYSYCRECTCAARKKSDRKYQTHPEHQAAKAAYLRKKRAEGGAIRVRGLKSARVGLARFPERVRARRMLRDAVAAGVIVRPAVCTRCGDKPPPGVDGRASIQGHHHNGYDRPYDVQWLCQRCHGLEHNHQRRARGEKP